MAQQGRCWDMWRRADRAALLVLQNALERMTCDGWLRNCWVGVGDAGRRDVRISASWILSWLFKCGGLNDFDRFHTKGYRKRAINRLGLFPLHVLVP